MSIPKSPSIQQVAAMFAEKEEKPTGGWRDLSISQAHNQKFESFIERLTQEAEDDSSSDPKHKRDRSLKPRDLPPSSQNSLHQTRIRKSLSPLAQDSSDIGDEVITRPPLGQELEESEEEDNEEGGEEDEEATPTQQTENGISGKEREGAGAGAGAGKGQAEAEAEFGEEAEEEEGGEGEDEEEVSVVSPFHQENQIAPKKPRKTEKKKKQKLKEEDGGPSTDPSKPKKSKKKTNTQEEEEVKEPKKKTKKKSSNESFELEDPKQKSATLKPPKKKAPPKGSLLLQQSMGLSAISVCDIPSTMGLSSFPPPSPDEPTPPDANPYVDLGSFPTLFEIALKTVSPSFSPFSLLSSSFQSNIFFFFSNT